MLPRVGVAFDKSLVAGVDRLEEAATAGLLDVLELGEALSRHWPTDAHLCLYAVPGEDAWPRINLPAREELRQAGKDPLCWGTALDWDTPGHVPLTPPWAAAVEETLTSGSVPTPTATWRTRSGYRLLYVWTRPISPEHTESLHLGLAAAYAAAGLPLDTTPTVSRWNTFHRLPHVVRDGQPTSDVHLQTSGPLHDPDLLPTLPAPRGGVNSKSIPTTPQPADEELQALVWEPRVGKGGEKLNPWAREIRKSLRLSHDGAITAALFPYSPEGYAPLPVPPGKRNTTIMAWAGALARAAYPLESSTPEHIYAALLPVVRQSTTPNDKDRDFAAETWKCVNYCWAREEARAQEAAQEAAAAQLEEADLRTRITQGVKAWPAPYPEPAKVPLMVVVDDQHFVMTPKGRYDDFSVRSAMLPARIRELGMDGLMPLFDEDDRHVKPQELRDLYAARAIEVAGVVGETGAWLDGEVLCRGLYARRTDLEPEFSPLIDEWLHHFAPPGRYEQFCRYTGLALAFERGPIAGVALIGEPGAGKQMYVTALSECLAQPNTGKVVRSGFDKFVYGMDRSPFVNVNEGWPPAGKLSIDAQFRALVGGDPTETEQKFQAKVTVEVNPRVILTANNDDVVQALFARRGMSAADVSAIGQRLIYMPVDKRASQWLEQRGGREFTAGWVKDKSVPSRFVAAKHFLWLHEKYGHEGGKQRFLMEGNPNVLWLLSTAHGSSPEVGEVLCRMAAAGKLKDGWTSATEVLGQFRLQLREHTRSTFDIASMGKAMTPFCTGARDPVRGRQIDLGKLKEFAEHYGLPMTPASTPARERKAMAA